MIMLLIDTLEEIISSEAVSEYSYPTQWLTNFLLSAAPYIIVFFVVILAFIAVLKIVLYHREKKLSSKPQNINRFDIDICQEEEKEGNDCS